MYGARPSNGRKRGSVKFQCDARLLLLPIYHTLIYPPTYFCTLPRGSVRFQCDARSLLPIYHTLIYLPHSHLPTTLSFTYHTLIYPPTYFCTLPPLLAPVISVLILMYNCYINLGIYSATITMFPGICTVSIPGKRGQWERIESIQDGLIL